MHGPDTLAFVEDAAAKLYSTLYGSIPFVVWKAQRGFATTRLSEALEAGCEYMVESNIEEFAHEGYEGQKNRVMYGLGHFGVFPHYEPLKRKDKDVCIGARYVSADFYNLLPCPDDYTAGRYGRYQWYREFLPEDEVAAMFEAGGPFEGDFAQVPKGSFAMDDKHKALLVKLGWEEWMHRADEDLWEVWHRYSKGHVISIINRSYCARHTLKKTAKNPKGLVYLPYNMPFGDMKYITWPKEYYGMGIPETIEQLQRDKNLVRSQHRENVDLALNAVLKVRRDALIDYENLEIYPTAIIPVNNPDDVTPLIIPDMTTQSVLPIEDKIEKDMERALGQSRYGMGLEPPHARETATTVLRLQQASFARMDTQIKLTEMVSIRSLAWKMAAILENNMHKGLFEDITSHKHADVFKEDKYPAADLRLKVKAVPLGSSLAAIKELRVEQMMRTLELVTSVPTAYFTEAPEPRQPNVPAIVVNTLLAMGLQRDEVERLIPRIGSDLPGNQGQVTGIRQDQVPNAQYMQDLQKTLAGQAMGQTGDI